MRSNTEIVAPVLLYKSLKVASNSSGGWEAESHALDSSSLPGCIYALALVCCLLVTFPD